MCKLEERGLPEHMNIEKANSNTCLRLAVVVMNTATLTADVYNSLKVKRSSCPLSST